ncbi:MAG TPA: 4-deoxy-4-formamido-L-arabinose-phosphoundecaprenol deformylase, partial [Candidatus Binatia bacterium]
NVHTVHAEVEGRPYLALFEDFLREIRRRKVATVLLKDVAAELLPERASVARLPVKRGSVPGRSGWVACQGE